MDPATKQKLADEFAARLEPGASNVAESVAFSLKKIAAALEATARTAQHEPPTVKRHTR
jgi:hypothetical protein